MRRYTKRVRDEAAMICSIAACTPKCALVFRDIAYALGLPVEGRDSHEFSALTLACKAWWHPINAGAGACWDAQRAAGAEQLIRTGWSP